METEIDPDEPLEQLVCQARAGCLRSFEALVRRNQDRLYTYLLQLVGNEHDAEDLTQETFIKVYHHLGSFDGRSRFSTWLFAIAKNSVFTFLRRKRAHLPIEPFQEMLPAPGERIDRDDRDSIWTLARTLKPQFFEVLWLFYAEGFSLKEIAEIQRSNAITVRVNLHRARRALARKCRIHEKP